MNIKKLALIPITLGGIALLCGVLFLYDAREPPDPCANFVAKS